MAEKIELNISANVSEAMKEVAGFRQQYAELVRAVEKPLRQVNSFRELESSLEQTGRKMREARDRVRDLGASLASVDRPTKEMAASYKLAVSELRALERQELTQIGQLTKMRAALQGAGVDMRNLAAEQSRLAQQFSSRLDAGRVDAAQSSARSSLGVGAIEQTQRQLVELRQQYRLVTSDSTLSAKQRAEAEANYRHSVEQTLTRLRELRQASSARAGSAGQSASSSPSTQQTSLAAARSALGVGDIEQTQRQLVELRQQYRLVTSDGTLSAKQRAEAEANYRNSVASTLTQLRAMRSSLNDNSQAMQRAGLSAGEYRQAMRMLPMQLTDVVTSLASGMPIWMVAIQQGGQIRDSFGGIGNAARAVVSSINPMAAAIGAASAAAGVLALAYYKGSEEQDRFNESLMLTGNYAGTTAGGLGAMARQVGTTVGTVGAAADVLAQLAGTGKITSDRFEEIAVAALKMEQATGKALAETVAEFAKIAEDPVKAVVQLNEQYHFLTASVYEQIRALQEQGDTLGAASLAEQALAEAQTARADKIIENLGYIETAWGGVKEAAKGAWDAVLDVGREDTLDQKLTKLQARLATIQQARVNPLVLGDNPNMVALSAGETGVSAEWTAALQKEVDDVAEARRKMFDAQNISAGTKAYEEIQKSIDATASKADKLTQALENNRRLIASARTAGYTITAEQEAALERQTRDQYKETAKRQKAVTDDAATRMLQQLRNQQATLESQLGSTDKLTEAQRQQAQFVQLIADLKEKKILTADQRSLLANEAAIKAQLAQNVALDEQVRKHQALTENARTNAGLEAELLRSQGKAGEAARIELEAQFAQAMRDLEKTGNQRGIQLMKDVLPIRQAQIQLDEIGKQIDKTFSRNDRAEQSIGVQLDAGLITETEARQKILDLRRKEADELERQLPVLEEIAVKGGTAGEAAQVQIDAIRDKITLARNAAGDFERALKSGLAGGIQEALAGLTDGTMNLRDAVTSLVSSVADAMLQLATQRLAEQATAGIMGLLGGGQSESSSQAAAITSASAVGGQSMAAAIVAAGVQAGAAMAAAISSAGTGQAAGGAASGASGASGIAGEIGAASSQGAAEMGSSITSASETGSGTFSSALDSVFSGGADLFGSLFDSLGGLFSGGGGDSIFSGILGGIGGLFGGGSVAAATGGHVTGPGTGTSDSISAWLSNNEFVTRAAVVQQPGALDFLHAFNAQDMAALDDYARRVRHATGGLAGVPAPALPAPSLGTTTLAEPAKAMSTQVQNAINLYAVQDEGQIASMAWSKPGQEHFKVFLQRNASTVRSLLKV